MTYKQKRIASAIVAVESGKTLSCGEEIGDISQHRDANRVSVTVLLDTPR